MPCIAKIHSAWPCLMKGPRIIAGQMRLQGKCFSCHSNVAAARTAERFGGARARLIALPRCLIALLLTHLFSPT
jgi:hypothetical protein